VLEERRNYCGGSNVGTYARGRGGRPLRSGETPRRTFDERTCEELPAIFLSRSVIAKDELVTHPMATNPDKGQRGANATDGDFTVNH